MRIRAGFQPRTMTRVLLLILLCVGQFAHAQSCLNGLVTDGFSDHPVAGAHVYVPEQQLLVDTDTAGQFVLCDLPKGTYTLQVTFEGYRTFIGTVSSDTDTLIRVVLNSAALEFQGVCVVADQFRDPELTPTDVVSISTDNMRDHGAMSLSDGVGNLPGVHQLTTGPGISKPVIRGLFGNRIQTVMLGLRFDNQQWQDEHGLGLSDMGVDRVEVIKGAASLLYGSEAMGGVLQIIEEKPAADQALAGDASLRYFTNTRGLAVSAGIRGSRNGKFWRIRLGSESHADYTDGNGDRVLNSRFATYNAKATFGFRKSNWLSQNDYMFSLSNFGFIMDSALVNMTEDARGSRSFDMPHHSVFLHAFSSRNTVYLRNSKLKLTAGFQLNDRQEQEGGSKISLEMILTSVSGKALWIKKISGSGSLSLGVETLYQDNLNVGSRMIVPDAGMFEGSAFGFYKYERKQLDIEVGLRYTFKNIKTKETGTLNTGGANPGTEILPFDRNYNALTGAFGVSWHHGKHWLVKSNLSSGFRPGNLAELSSNGLHEGSLRYEIGNTNMRTEKNLCVDVVARFDSKGVTLRSSAYINRFLDYIYLAPTGEEYIGFQIYRYLQQNATLKGVESTVEIHPEKVKPLLWIFSHTLVQGTTDDGAYLPFIPAQKLASEIRISGAKKWRRKAWVSVGGNYLLAQNRPAQFETATPGYFILNTGLGKEWKLKKHTLYSSVHCSNLLNEVYVDHLARYKYFGIYNMGRSIMLNVKFEF